MSCRCCWGDHRRSHRRRVVGGRCRAVVQLPHKPYTSLRITSGDDVTTFAVLAIVSLIAAELEPGLAEVDARSRAEIDRLYRIAAMSAGGADIDDVVSAARAELIGLFGLVDCVYEPGPPPVLRASDRAAHSSAPSWSPSATSCCPPAASRSPSRRGRTFGRLVLIADREARAPLEKRLVAVAIADELGLTFAALPVAGRKGRAKTDFSGTALPYKAVMLDTLKRVVVGRPLASAEQEHQRLIKVIALAVFSSGAISSTACDRRDSSRHRRTVRVSSSGWSARSDRAAVALLLAIVAASYRQTICAYPSGGGSYVVSRENLGENPSLVAGASLLVDYILTVAVSISAGVAAIVSIPQFDGLRDHRVGLGVGLILLISIVNLRGLKESGRLFAYRHTSTSS